MGSKETRLHRGRRRGLDLASRTLGELRIKRVTHNVSLETMAGQLGCATSTAWRRERDAPSATVVGLAEMASVLGYELSIGLHPVGDAVRDRAQLAIGRRVDALFGPAWSVMDEVLLPNPGDRRAWDKLARLRGAEPRHVVGVDIESRIRDVQALVRRTRERERDGGVDAILIVLSDSAANRRLVGHLRESLGPAYATSPRLILAALRQGRPLPGSGVVLI